MKLMKKSTRYITITICLTLLLTSMSPSVRADTLQDQLDQYQQKAKQLDIQLKSQELETSTASSQALNLQNSINALKDSATRYQTAIGQQVENLKVIELKKQKSNEERQKNIEALSSFLRNNYEVGTLSYLQVILQACSLSDLMNRLEDVSLILNAYSKLQSDLTLLNADINTQQLLITKKRDELQNSIKENQQTQQNLQLVSDKQNLILNQLASQEKITLQTSLANRNQINRVQQLIEQEAIDARSAELERISPSSPNMVIDPFRSGTTSQVKVEGGVQSILNYAAQFIGTPYVWGGTSPSPGFDCSGFTQYVFNHAGIRIDRISQDQFQDGTAVSIDNLQPGDLVFFHTYGLGATHVGIYVGNGVMINSASGGVGYDDLNDGYWGSRYVGARRIVAQ
ncbi:MAG: NlpC/P60 family protein [Desulfitobacteriaceae bacterium]